MINMIIEPGVCSLQRPGLAGSVRATSGSTEAMAAEPAAVTPSSSISALVPGLIPDKCVSDGKSKNEASWPCVSILILLKSFKGRKFELNPSVRRPQCWRPVPLPSRFP